MIPVFERSKTMVTLDRTGTGTGLFFFEGYKMFVLLFRITFPDRKK